MMRSSIRRIFSIITRRPRNDFLSGRDKDSTSRLIIFARFDPNGPQTIPESICEFVRHSRFRTDCFNLYFTLSRMGFIKPNFIDFSRYDGIVLHHTLCYEQKLLWPFVKWLKKKIGDLPIIVMRQDENIRVNFFVDFLTEYNVKLLLTTVPELERPKVYPLSRLPRLRFLPVMTSYVSDSLRALIHSSNTDRDIDVSYRAASNPPWFGRLCLDKVRIAKLAAAACAARGLRYDISTIAKDRIDGDAWYTFLGRSKAVLGVESGASVFDFSGEIEDKCRLLMRNNPSINPEEIWRKIVAPHDGNIIYGQVGPRHFEAAACGAVQILQEGTYSGIFIPRRHYIPLNADFSNFDQAIDELHDPKRRNELVEAAIEEIVMNDAYSYQAFITRFDNAIEEALEA